MNISEIRVKLLPRKTDKLRAFASITLDECVVVRDIKIIEGGDHLFVAMPSRKLCDRCPSCGGKNHLRARYCNDCGTRQGLERTRSDERGRPRLYADVSHPINQRARDQIQGAIIAAYHEEVERSKQEGYQAVRFDDLDYDYLEEYTQE
ncbi:MAG: SpoVG family protein [Planctomycetota bacterium]|nr:SpoVG family protein [Planctomycetota bacterium]